MWNFSYEKGEIPPYAQSNSGSISVSDDKSTITLKIVSSGANKAEVGETLTHETQSHGFNIADKMIGKTTTTTTEDHKALKTKDTKHQGYKQYKSMQQQLQKIDEAYKKAFENAHKQYQQY